MSVPAAVAIGIGIFLAAMVLIGVFYAAGLLIAKLIKAIYKNFK